MHNHLPRVDPTRSFDGGHRARESEQAAMQRLHREHSAANRARGDAHPPATPLARRILTAPASMLTLLSTRR
jgi:hypothetical protein